MSRRPEWWMNVLRIFWPLTELSARMTQWPVVGRLFFLASLPVFTGRNFNISYIPINKTIQGISNILIPEMVLEELIRRSSHRVIIKRCTCRDNHECKNHPIEDACILLGDGAAEIDPRVARHVSVDEAIAHMKRRVNEGLIPFAGRVRMDDFFWECATAAGSLQYVSAAVVVVLSCALLNTFPKKRMTPLSGFRG